MFSCVLCKIPISISFYIAKNAITCRRKEEEKNSMKLGFRSAALLFVQGREEREGREGVVSLLTLCFSNSFTIFS